MNNLTIAALFLSLTTPIGVICGLELHNGVYMVGIPLLAIATILEYFGFRNINKQLA